MRAAKKKRTTTAIASSPILGALIVDEACGRRGLGSCPSCPAPARPGSPRSTASRPDAEILTSARELADYFEQLAALAPAEVRRRTG